MEKYDVIKLLADQTRFNIFRSLLDFDQLCVSEIENLLGIKQANTSKHLRKMKDFGLIDSKRDGNVVYYHVTAEFLKDHEILVRYLFF